VEFAMKLHTAYYLPKSSCEMPDPMIGLLDLHKGLNTILLGYLLSLGNVLIVGGAVWYLIAQTGGKPLSLTTVEQASTVLFAAALLFGLAMIGSALLIVRGKWMCLSSTRERYHAKWMMFLSIRCILTGLALNFGAFLVGESKAAPRGRPRNNTAAVALSWGAAWRAVFTELYLLFVGILAAGVVVLFRRPSFMLARPQLLLGLGGGWLLAGLWYFVLILNP
jgi:hypothetical protein